MPYSHNTAPTRFIDAGGSRFAYRRFGTPGRTPIVFTQRFMGNLDDFDPAITDAFASDREVILFDNAGVGAAGGEAPASVEEMARAAAAFVDAVGLREIDLLGHCLGGLVAQQLALDRPDVVRRVILIGTGPRGGEEIGSHPEWVAQLFAGVCARQQEMWLPLLFSSSEFGQTAGRGYLDRIAERGDRDDPVSAQAMRAQREAIASYGANRDSDFPELKALTQPVLVVNGDDDVVMPTVNSYILQQHLPNAQLLLYPDSGHGSHHQYHETFTRHARYFLDR